MLTSEEISVAQDAYMEEFVGVSVSYQFIACLELYLYLDSGLENDEKEDGIEKEDSCGPYPSALNSAPILWLTGDGEIGDGRGNGFGDGFSIYRYRARTPAFTWGDGADFGLGDRKGNGSGKPWGPPRNIGVFVILRPLGA
jgi:hypothetical protein